MKHAFRIFGTAALAVLLVIVAGCAVSTIRQHGKTSALDAKVASTDAAVVRVDTATADVDAKRDTRDSRVRASVDTARQANDGNTDGPAKAVVDSELSVAQDLLGEAKPEDLAAAADRRALVESGRADEAREAYAEAKREAAELLTAVGTAKAERESAVRDRDAAREAERHARVEFAAELERNRVAAERALAAATAETERQRNEFEDARRQQIVNGLRWLGLAFIVIGVGFAALTKGMEWQRALWFVAGGVLANGAAVAINHWIFPWLFWGAVTVGVGALAWWVYTEHRNKILGTKAKALSVDLVAAVEEIRAKLKKPSAAVVQAVVEAKTPAEAATAIQTAVRGEVDAVLKSYVTEADGTAAHVDAIRREQGLI